MPRPFFCELSHIVQARNGCGTCIDCHERILTRHGVKPEAIPRIAAVMKAVATVHATL